MQRNRAGFTLVELLVVIGIISVLIGILLPSVMRARRQAVKTQDLSNIRQLVTAAVAYSATNKGVYPMGSRNYGTYNDDLQWTNSDTFDYFLQFCNTRKVFATDIAKDPRLGRMMTCNSIQESAPTSSINSTTYYNYSPSYREMMLGWTYYGNRYWQAYIAPTTATPNPVLTPAAPVVVQRTGTSDGTLYQMPNKQGQHATSRTLMTCWHNNPPGYSSFIPHRAHSSYSRTTVAASTNWVPLEKYWDGMCMGYTDGSARYVPPGDFGCLRWPNNLSTGNAMYFYDATAR